jgi:hypothetical protein
MKRTVAKLIPYRATAAYILLTVIVYLASLALHSSKVLEGVFTLKDAAETAIGLIKDISTLSGTWAAGLIAGAATVCVKGRDWSHGWTAFDSLTVVGVLAGGVLTYYGIYCTYIRLYAMAAAGAFVPLSPDLSVALAIQYYSALSGTLLLGLVFARMLDRRIQSGTRVD